MKPSNNTVASLGVGVPLATLISWGVSTYSGVQIPGPVEAALGAVLGAGIGYGVELVNHIIDGRKAEEPSK